MIKVVITSNFDVCSRVLRVLLHITFNVFASWLKSAWFIFFMILMETGN